MTLKPYKIMYLIIGLGPGGAETNLFRILKRLDRSVFQPVVIYFLKIPGPLEDKIKALGVEVHFVGLKSMFDLLAYSRLYRLIKEWSPDILHTQTFVPDIAGRIIGRFLKVPVIITSIRNVYYGGFGRYFLFRLTEKFADRTTFVSRAAAERFVELNVLPESKVQVIHNGLSPDIYYSGLNEAGKKKKRKELNLPEEGFMFLAVGSLKKQKGYEDLFKALKLMDKTNSEFYLAVVGNGYYRSEEAVHKKQVKELDLAEKIIFIGHSDHVPAYMAAADALVLSSLWEGLPGVVMEAMASELPVVATAVGGTPELVVDGETGYLVSPGKPDELGRALSRITELPEGERRAMGKAGRSRVEEYFHVDKMVEAYVELYKDCLRNKNML